jgi:hypothetical protein
MTGTNGVTDPVSKQRVPFKLTGVLKSVALNID